MACLTLRTPCVAPAECTKGEAMNRYQRPKRTRKKGRERVLDHKRHFGQFRAWSSRMDMFSCWLRDAL